MLFPNQTEIRQPIPYSDLSGEVPAQSPACTAICLVQSIAEWVEGNPYLFFDQTSGCVEVLFQNVPIPCLEFSEMFGFALLSLQKNWAVLLYGAAENGELVQMQISREDKHFVLTQQSISGKRFAVLNGICLHIACTDKQTAWHLYAILKEMHPHTAVIAADWQHSEFIRSQQIGDTDSVNGFCYVFLENDISVQDKLCSLSFEQKRKLWIAFLKDGVQPLEFEWLAGLLYEQTPPPDWLEWSLSLHLSLQALGYSFKLNQTQFELFDASGKRLYYGINHAGAAERVLMKILFPINL